ncbi:MAG: LacI family DNA-binding transcriptional regulator [Verrucomicrobiota bacterium]|nr:LacI family DNA-binding transcriptional regulator [Verrucomicrobiota bacterium]
MPRITLKQVAERAGISVAAVSQALRSTGNVSDKTRHRVRQIADEMGYIPNPILASLGAQHFRTGTESVLIPMTLILPAIGPFPNMLKSEYDSMVALHGAYARKLGYALHGLSQSQVTDWALLARTLYHRGVSGVVLVPRVGRLPNLSDEWNRFALVVVGNNPVYRRFHPVYVDHYDLIHRAWQEAKALGYKRIGWAIMRHEPEVHDDTVRRAAAEACVAAMPAHQRVPVLWDFEINDRESVLAWYRQYKPEVVIGFHIGLAWGLLDHGICIPKDVAFINLHNLNPRDTINGLSIAGMTEMDHQLIPFAIDHMDQLIRHRMYGFNSLPRKVLLNADWEHGDTCPPK